MSATCGGIRVVCVYVPNGREPDSDHYRYKLAWLESLSDDGQAGTRATVVLGDMNIAPTDEDVFDPAAYVGQTHVTQPERDALAHLQAAGLRDVVRERWPDERVFTYWDYRAGHVPPGPRDADRPRPRQRRRRRPRQGGLDRPPGAARARARATTRR